MSAVAVMALGASPPTFARGGVAASDPDLVEGIISRVDPRHGQGSYRSLRQGAGHRS